MTFQGWEEAGAETMDLETYIDRESAGKIDFILGKRLHKAVVQSQVAQCVEGFLIFFPSGLPVQRGQSMGLMGGKVLVHETYPDVRAYSICKERKARPRPG